MNSKKTIIVQAVVNASIESVWKVYTEPKHIMKWNNASEDWHTPRAQNDLRVGGKFNYRMESRDGSHGFDFNGIYNEVKKNEIIAYAIEGGREVIVKFSKGGAKTKVVVSFEAEDENPIEMQRDGWQSILNNFKKYVESS